MQNKTDKPKLSARQLILKMKEEKRITFKYISEAAAEEYLTNVNNYLRTAAYRKNYQKHTKGPNAGKYIKLDFAYLQELATLDMHFQFIVSKMCLDIEHALKVKIIQNIEQDPSTDGYDVVQAFLEKNFGFSYGRRCDGVLFFAFFKKYTISTTSVTLSVSSL